MCIRDRVNTQATAFSDGDRKKIKESGKTEILQLTPEQRTAWQTAMKPVIEQFTPKIGKEIVDAAIAANKP